MMAEDQGAKDQDLGASTKIGAGGSHGVSDHAGGRDLDRIKRPAIIAAIGEIALRHAHRYGVQGGRAQMP